MAIKTHIQHTDTDYRGVGQEGEGMTYVDHDFYFTTDASEPPYLQERGVLFTHSVRRAIPVCKSTITFILMELHT